jgi:hypothetical protein
VPPCNSLVIIAPAGGTVIITPTNADGTTVAVTINGKAQSLPISSSAFGHILVYGQSGNDVIKEVSTTIGGKTAFFPFRAA